MSRELPSVAFLSYKCTYESRTTPRESYCGLPPQWGCAVNLTAVAAVLIDQSRYFMNLYTAVQNVHWIAARLPNSEIWGFCGQHLATLATPTIRSIKCKQSPVYGVFDSYFHIHLPILTKHELGLPFPSRNLPIKFGTNPSTVFVVIVFTNRQTDKPTPVKTYFHAFAGKTDKTSFSHFMYIVLSCCAFKFD